MTENTRIGTNIFKIFSTSFILYMKNILPLTRVMLFPVFGQIFGIVLILGIAFFYSEFYLSKIVAGIYNHNPILAVSGMFILIVPGFVLFIKAFWEYLVVMISLNTMVRDIDRTGKFENFKMHNSRVAARKKDYIILLLIITLIWIAIVSLPFLSLIPSSFIGSASGKILYGFAVIITVILTIIVSVKLCLAFQVFSFETLSPSETIKKSSNILKNNFWRTVIMGIILYIITDIISQILPFIVSKTPLIDYVKVPFEPFAYIFASNPQFAELLIKAGMTPSAFSAEVALYFLATTVLVLMTPLGSVCFTLLYFDILERKNANV